MTADREDVLSSLFESTVLTLTLPSQCRSSIMHIGCVPGRPQTLLSDMHFHNHAALIRHAVLRVPDIWPLSGPTCVTQQSSDRGVRAW